MRSLRASDPRELGPYRIVGRLGEGGMGSVFLAQTSDDTYVALKVIRSELADDAEFRLRFRSEVSRARQVPPFCTAEVLDADIEHDPPYLVVEYVDGPSLGAVVQERGPLSPANQHGLAVGVAVALTAIHGAGVIHRDLKPSNVLLAPGSPKVIDFGIARAVDATHASTTTDHLIGTVAYMAPERFGPEGSKALTPAADIFAWGGVVAYAGLGRTPFGADIPAALAIRIMTGQPDLHGLQGPLRELVEHALAKNPADRPTARELVDGLLATGSGRPARPAAFAEQPEVLAAAGIAPNPPTRSTVVAGGLPAGQPTVERLSSHGSNGDRTTEARRLDDGGRRGGRVVTAALAASVLLLAGTVAAYVTGVLPPGDAAAGGASPSTTPTLSATTPGASPSASGGPTTSPTAGPVPSVVAGAKPALTDPLTAEGEWEVVEDLDEMATCEFDGRYVVTRGLPGSFRCRGNQTPFTDFSVFVDVTLISPSSCAGVWFRFANERGYALRVCESSYYLVIHGSPSAATVKTLREFRFVGEPVPLEAKTRVGITAEGNSFRFYRDGKLVGQFVDSESNFPSGRVTMGVFPVGVVVLPPYQVAFSDIQILTPTGF